MIKKILGIATICLLSITTASAVDCDGIDVGGGRAFGIGLGEYGLYNSGNNDCGLNIEFNGSIDGNFNFNGNVFRYDAIYGDTYFWRTSEGLRYQFNRYNSTTVYNGLINGFFACSEVPAFGSNYYLKNVNSCTYHEGFDSLSDYLQNPTSWGYLTKLTTSSSNMAICVYANNNYICMDRSHATDTSTTLISYDTVNSEAISNPFSNNGGGNNIPQRNSNSICPTMGQILNNYPTAYNTGLCYNSTLKYNNGQIETVDQNTIQEIFTNYNELQERWNIYNNNCRVPYTQEQCQGAFSGQRNKYSIISNAINGNTESKRLWNYCNIYLNYDLNMSSCVASGYQGEEFTEKEIQDTLLGLDEIRILTPGTGNVLNSLLENGQTREDINIYDVLGNLEQIKEKITSIFNERHGVDGIIPDYILWLILTTLLLTVLLKK